MATFRGYADQRHVTVLALRDERQRNREIAAELSSHAQAASAVSHMVTAGRRARRLTGNNNHDSDDDDNHDEEEDGARRLLTNNRAPLEGSLGRRSSAGLGDAAPITPPAAAAVAEAVSRTRTGDALPGGKKASSPRGATVTVPEQLGEGGAAGSQRSATAREREEHLKEAKTTTEAVAGGGAGDGEQASLEAIRKALAEAAEELSRRRAAFEVEREARVAVQLRVKEADRLTRAAELRAEASEGNAERVRGRVSVLERNVDYLQGQQRALR